jgi:Tfp pilus assembly protein PilF
MIHKFKSRKRANAYFEEAMNTRGRKRRAMLLEHAIRLDNEFADAYLELGITYLDLDEVEKAESMLRTSISLDDDGWAHLYLGNLFFGLENWDAAEIEFRLAKQRLPDLSVPLWCIADVYRARGDVKKSEKFYRAAVELEPKDATSLAHLGRLLLENKRRDEGTQYIRRALKEDKSCKSALKWKRQYKIGRVT